MIELLREAELFQGLSTSQLEYLAMACVKKDYPTGTIIFQQNELGTIFYIVVSGSVKLFSSNRSGEDIILSICTDGDSFGELSLLDGKPRSATAQTIDQTVLLTLSAQNFHT